MKRDSFDIALAGYLVLKETPLVKVQPDFSYLIKREKKEYEPVYTSDKHADEGNSNIGDDGKKKEKEFEGEEGLDDEDDHHPLPKIRPPHGKSRRGTDVQLESTRKQLVGQQVSINFNISSN